MKRDYTIVGDVILGKDIIVEGIDELSDSIVI